MAFVKLVDELYHYTSDVKNIMYYITSPIKCNNLVGGSCNIISSAFINPEFVAEQFLIIQKDRSIRRRIYHLIVALDQLDECNDLNLAFSIGQKIIYMYPDYQSVFVVHENKEYLHLHIIFNNCPVLLEKPVLSKIINVLKIKETVEFMIDYHLGIPMIPAKIVES